MVADRYRETYAAFRWNVPADFNITEWACRRWARQRHRLALHWEDIDLEVGELRIREAIVRTRGKIALGPTKTLSSRRQLRLPDLRPQLGFADHGVGLVQLHHAPGCASR